MKIPVGALGAGRILGPDALVGILGPDALPGILGPDALIEKYDAGEEMLTERYPVCDTPSIESTVTRRTASRG